MSESVFISRSPIQLVLKYIRNMREVFRKSTRILRYFRPHAWIWMCLYLVAFFYVVLALVNPLITKFLIDDVLVNKNEQLLLLLVWAFIVINVFVVITEIITSYLYQKFEALVLYEVRNDLFRHFESLDSSFFAKRKLGDILTRLTRDVEGIAEFVSLFFNTLVLNIFSAVVTIGIALSLNWQLTVAALMVVPFVMFTQKHYGKLLRAQYKRMAIISSEYLSYITERLSAISAVKGFAREDYELDRQKKKAMGLISMRLRATLTQNIAGGVSGLLIFLALVYVTWEGSHMVFADAITIGTLVAISTYINGLFGPVRALTDLNISFQTTMVYVDRVFTILDMKPTIKDAPGAKELEKVKGRIEFRKIGFVHKDRNGPVIKKLSLKIRPGEMVGIVGQSGCGKTTLTQMLARFYDPSRGKVLIDGHDIRKIKLSSLRERVSIVPQEPVLFNTTIRENIAYGKPHAHQYEIEHVAALAEIHEFIAALPHGYETVVGEKGVALSGGQMQRVAVARMLLKNPDIIVLDEALSFLDGKNESQIIGVMRSMLGRKTIIVTTHRISALSEMDRIVVMDGGRIVEEGTYDQLAEKGKLFRKLYLKKE